MKYSPLPQNERIELIDAARGFALFGILMVNMPYMYEPMSQVMLGAKPDASVQRVIAESFIKFFFEGKFYVIFSILFGFGFWVFLDKSKENEKSSLPAYKRRLLFLALFGLAHVVFLWAGDILLFYSVFGFLLILFRKASDKKIFRWAVIFTLVPTFLTALMAGIISLFSRNPEIKDQIDIQLEGNVIVMEDLIARATSVYSSASFTEIVSIRIEEFFTLLGGSLFFFCPVVLAMFLIGFLIARRGIASNYTTHLPLFEKVFWWGLAIGMITNSVYIVSYRYTTMNVPDLWTTLTTTMHTFGGISLGLCYLSGIAILFIKGKSEVLTRYFAPIGRMALTNYLMQSIICSILFHSYGFGYYGRVEVWQGIILAVLIFALQVQFSRWWLGRFRYGPFEWLWRSLTYLRLQPMK